LKSTLNWEKASVGENELRIAMTKLFAQHPQLLPLLFYTAEAKLRHYPDVLLREARCLSSGEFILIQLALDIWNDSGGTRIYDLLNRLDTANFQNAMMALRYVGPKESDPPDLKSLLCSDPAWEKSLF
jgi:hypothetical protein